MHILMTTDTVGGVWTYTQELVSALTDRGITLTLVSFGAMPTNAQTEWLRDRPEVDYRPTSFRLEWMQDAAADVERSRRYLQEVIRGVRPDLLHSNQFCYGSVQADIPRVVVAHSDVVSWWHAVLGTAPPQNEWSWYRREVERGLRAADRVVAPSQWMMGTLVDNYRFSTEKRVIYNGRNESLFKSSSTRSKYAMSVGRVWDKGKQLDLLLNQHLDIPVYIAGATGEPGGKLGPAELHGSSARLTGLLSQADLRELYSRASIYIATSRYEPFGLAPLEAALSGCALIANDIPVFRELWGGCAMYFEPNDARALARAVSDLAENDSLRQELAGRAQLRARQNFNVARMADEYCELYEQVCAREHVA